MFVINCRINGENWNTCTVFSLTTFTDLNSWPREALRYERMSVGVCAFHQFSGPHIIAKCWLTVCDSNGSADTYCVSSWQALKFQEGFMWITKRLLVHIFKLVIKALADVESNAAFSQLWIFVFWLGKTNRTHP